MGVGDWCMDDRAITPLPNSPSQGGTELGCGKRQIIAFIIGFVLIWPIATHAAEVRDLIGECAFCHGDAGIAKDKDVPHLAGQQSDYLYNQLFAFRTGKRRHKEMRYMSRHMTEPEMRAIADYYASLPR